MTKLTKEEVEHIAKLANLTLKDGEKEKFAVQLGEVLGYVEKVCCVATEKISPLFNVTGKKNVFRDDEVKPSLSQNDALKNAPSTYKGYFKVKAIFED